MSGKPRELYVDNAAEFKSEALRRACHQHGIDQRYRPPGQPHFGGIVKRLIGTMMPMVHDELPGTTFSNSAQRSTYDSDGKAVLTVAELNAWLALAVPCVITARWMRSWAVPRRHTAGGAPGPRRVGWSR